MTETTLKNLKENGNKISENANTILKLLCENVSLITGSECICDIMFDGSVTIVYGEVKTRHMDGLKATDYLNGLLKDFFKQHIIY